MGEEIKQNSGLAIERYFSRAGDPYATTTWNQSDVTISDDQGKALYTQKGVEFPAKWSDLARKIVASKYFYGENGTDQRENSIRQLIGRVSGTITDWGTKQDYFRSSEDAKAFREEIAALTLDQRMAFNSPVWFNVGVDQYLKDKARKVEQKKHFIYDKQSGMVIPLPIGKEYEHPQTSACFIQSVNDTMEDIMQLAYNEAMLFKYGSGTGTDLSTLRSSREKLSGGGIPSGPLAYLLFYDKVAGIVKSGGKTRRAAKMNSLQTEHPDIMEFIECKKKEQKKLELLMDAGGLSYSEAESTVGYQNANLSIRASDAFMRAVEQNKEWQTIPVHNKDMLAEMPRYNAKDLFRKLAEGTHLCGDPGMQFNDTINKWHTCPVSAPINASNPCSEYMFVDNSSCNLASLNLVKFLKENGKFDIDGFKKAVRATAIAQDLLYDNSSFPTKEIAENSHKFRPLGMGYANLGALLMKLGVPYDSEEGRDIAGGITSLLTSTAYETSAEMAMKIAPFEEFAKNREPMLNVIGMHLEASKKLDRKIKQSTTARKTTFNLEEVIDEANKTWEIDRQQGEQYGFRNAQTTVLAPTGTIGFMMDCDTTGIEPETWLYKEKNLSDGGVLPILNKTIDPALKNLGYSDEQITTIKKYMEEKKTIEGAPGLKPEDVAVFDCTYKAPNGKRTIHYTGHIGMMAAVQPFLSGAISKTVGLPNDVTIEEIENVYMDAWKAGLKAVALYRDGSKRRQPLTAGKSDLEKKVDAPEVAAEPKAVRTKLPGTCLSVRHKFNVSGHEGYLHVGINKKFQPMELFIEMSKEGTTVGGLMDTIGTLTSFAFQYGVPVQDLTKKLKGNRFEPYGLVFEGDPEIKEAKSLPDYIFSYIEKLSKGGKDKIIELVGLGDLEPVKHENPATQVKPEVPVVTSQIDSALNDPVTGEELGGFCAECGKQMTKKGHCLEVCSCGWVNPKGCGE